ncbi:AraC family transcriptional regulator [Zhongshania aquimaris]|uniref:AraC family transcriptional regulator n=1 Tax=Zhongshania aquimaris TaxID=2857107 RepID=A0ABS6VPP0_9GAMM|nr:AraC family transcriptional regulator [Zhongshania aquimaris]MBW2939998.1 AraC family transcriptional regulator [Zhongshania aquimaris]
MMLNEEIKIPTSYIQTLLNRVQERGYDTEQLLKEAQIDRAELEQHRYFSAVRFGKLYQCARGAMQDEWFGMLTGGKIHKGSFRLLSLLMVQCKTLRQALRRAREFGHICRGFKITVGLDEIDDVARVRMEALDHVDPDEYKEIITNSNPATIRTTMAAWQRHWSWLIGSEVTVLKTYFAFPKPKDDWEMAQFSSKETVFDHDFNGFEFPRALLDYSIIQTAETAEEFVRIAQFSLIVNIGEEHTTKSRIKAMLNQNVGHNMLCADRVAERLNMSLTTLRRHLQVEDTSFQRLKDECRMEAAFHYLGCPDISNREIAERLGFDEVSVFFRAFKKWTGLTPGQYRTSHSVGD